MHENVASHGHIESEAEGKWEQPQKDIFEESLPEPEILMNAGLENQHVAGLSEHASPNKSALMSEGIFDENAAEHEMNDKSELANQHVASLSARDSHGEPVCLLSKASLNPRAWPTANSTLAKKSCYLGMLVSWAYGHS